MEQHDQTHFEKRCSKEVIQQEQVICAVAADLLVMNKLLEDSNKEPQSPAPISTYQKLVMGIKIKMKRLFK